MSSHSYTGPTGLSVTAAEALDGRGVLRDGYRFASGGWAGPGDYIGFDMAFVDSASPRTRFTDTIPAAGLLADAAHARFNDAAGKPLRLVDADTGAPVHLTADYVAAIQAEAGTAGMPLADFLRVLRYNTESTS